MWIDGDAPGWMMWTPLILNSLIIIAFIGLVVVFIRKYIKKVVQKEMQLQNDNTKQNCESS